jgi:predicted aspartyl protease
VRLKGRNGSVREYCALVDQTSDYCVIPRVDAYRLGYPEASHDDLVTTPANLVMVSTATGYAQGMMIVMQLVEIGGIKVESLPFLGVDLPQVMGYDVVVGRNFFEKTESRLEIDFLARKIKITKENRNEEKDEEKK